MKQRIESLTCGETLAIGIAVIVLAGMATKVCEAVVLWHYFPAW